MTARPLQERRVSVGWVHSQSRSGGFIDHLAGNASKRHRPDRSRSPSLVRHSKIDSKNPRVGSEEPRGGGRVVDHAMARSRKRQELQPPRREGPTMAIKQSIWKRRALISRYQAAPHQATATSARRELKLPPTVTDAADGGCFGRLDPSLCPTQTADARLPHQATAASAGREPKLPPTVVDAADGGCLGRLHPSPNPAQIADTEPPSSSLGNLRRSRAKLPPTAFFSCGVAWCGVAVVVDVAGFRRGAYGASRDAEQRSNNGLVAS